MKKIISPLLILLLLISPTKTKFCRQDLSNFSSLTNVVKFTACCFVGHKIREIIKNETKTRKGFNAILENCFEESIEKTKIFKKKVFFKNLALVSWKLFMNTALKMSEKTMINKATHIIYGKENPEIELMVNLALRFYAIYETYQKIEFKDLTKDNIECLNFKKILYQIIASSCTTKKGKQFLSKKIVSKIVDPANVYFDLHTELIKNFFSDLLLSSAEKDQYYDISAKEIVKMLACLYSIVEDRNKIYDLLT